MKKLLILCIAFSIGFSQDGDFTHLEFYPLHIGDVWQYQIDTGNYETYRIIGDTIMPNGETYFMKQLDTWSFIEYLRVDSILSHVLNYDTLYCTTNSEMIKYPLIPYNDTITTVFPCENYYRFEIEYIDTTHLEIQYDWLFYEVFSFEKGIGLTHLFGEEGGTWSETLIGAIVDGVEYGEILSIEDESSHPESFELYSNYPNPYNASTTIPFRIHQGGIVEIEVFDISGKVIEVIELGNLSVGLHKFNWSQPTISSGVYLIKVSLNEISRTNKVLLIK